MLTTEQIRFLIRPHTGQMKASDALPQEYRRSRGSFLRVLLLLGLLGVSAADVYLERRQPRKMSSSMPEHFYALSAGLHASFYLLNAYFLVSNRRQDRSSTLLPFFWSLLAIL